MLDLDQLSHVLQSVEGGIGPTNEDWDPNPCPEDNEFFFSPDAESMEVNLWLWQFRRGKPQIGELTIEQTETGNEAVPVLDARNKHAAETRQSRKTPPA